ncbi:MAG: C10 family peptidase [Muribaculaceae bacterium]|nr:C10 family peptidase [Muribaculaceae bacterium]
MIRHFSWIAIPSILLGTSIYSYSEKVSLTEAQTLATEFVRARSGNLSGDVTLEPVFIAGTESNPLYYVFNVADNGGFVMISGETTTTPVVGYSFEGSYPAKNMPDGMKWMLTGIEREIKAAPSLQSNQSVTELRKVARKAGERAAEKRLNTPQWSQEGPFNAMIPGKPLVGCVGTAMATIMKYHNYPAAGTGSFGGVDFATSYDWDNMRMDNYRSGYSAEEGDAVATLMYHASKSIDTQYAMSGSSAYEVRVPGALSTYFGYDPGVSYKKRSEVATQQAWDNLVKDEIDAGRPVLYCGQDVTAGHAFVCDGYQGDYLHFNWGWGGSADGYFLSTLLNPTVSRTHNYNNLNTIIYNIKPATGTVAAWSPIHITADGNQAGIGSDLTDFASGRNFKVRVGNLKNLAHADFNGKIAVALCNENGAVKALLSSPAALSMVSMGYLPTGYKDFNNCALPSGTSVDSKDRIRIVTQEEGQNVWLPVAGELLTLNELDPNTTSPASFMVALPAVSGVSVEGEQSVIRGWDYTFKVTPANAAEDVVTVKANGITLVANSGRYTINNVRENQEITILVQKASEVKEKRSVWVGTPGTLSTIIPESETGTIKDLTLFGNIDARDFAFMKSSMNLRRLDISGVRISASGSDQANAIPRDAFRGKGSLKEVILPGSVNRFNNACFAQSGITSINIPAGVSKYEYNIFVACTALRDIYVGRENAEFINWCVLSGVKTDLVTLHVPSERAVSNYKKAENWNTIANVIVDKPEVKNDVLFAVMENNEVKFETTAQTGSMEKGSSVSFKASHIADNDNMMTVYANSTRLTPDADGNYNVTLADNTIIHFDLAAPTAVDAQKSVWSLTDKNGSVGMFSDAVNVIPGQEFTIRLNALNIPKGYDQAYWGAVLTDKDGNIKEFISPVNVWSAGPGESHKLNVNCKVSDSNVREGNQIRIATSFNKKNWNLVKGATADIIDALPALNNMTPVYNINISDVKGAAVSGLTSTAVRGRDMTLKIVPNSASHRVDLKVNGVEVLHGQASVNYNFVAMEDMNFEANVYDPKADGVATFNVAPGTFHNQLTADNVAATVVVKGSLYSSDIQHATGKDFAIRTIKTLDLSGVTIVAQEGYEANVVNHPFFVTPNAPSYPASVVENIILPDNVVRLAGGIFSNCAKIKEITLPKDLRNVPVERTTASGGKVYDYGMGSNTFKGCTALTTIYIPGAPGDYNGTPTVAHHNPSKYDWYNLGHADPKKVTVVVPNEYLTTYKSNGASGNYSNPWKAHGYNILSEYPVYSVNFDPTRVKATEGTDVSAMASFLGDNVSLESISADGKLMLVNPQAKCKVFDNGEEIQLNADGSIPVTFYNPAKNAEKAGHHEITVLYSYDVNFCSTSPSFTISEPEVTTEGSNFDKTDALNPVLRDVAENSEVRFKVDFSTEHADGLEARVMVGNEELLADAEGYYSVTIANAGKNVDIFAVPTEGATLNSEDLAAIKPEEAAAITTISLEGEMNTDDLAQVKECFPNLESLDLSGFEGELPSEAFSGMTALTTVVLPEIEEVSANMFEGCENLQSIDIPATVSSIGAGAFKDCSSLETITLTGVSSIGDGAFAGCDNLTTITLLAASSDPKSEARRKSHRKAGSLSSKAFNGLNPNCIVVLDEGVEIPAAAANYLRTKSDEITETEPDGSVVTRQGRIYSANTDITFVQGYALAIPYAFTLEDGAVVSLEAETDNWTAMVVPFDVETITDATNNDMTITLAEDGAEYVNGNLIYTLPENGEALQSVDNMKANVPYIIRTENAGKTIFAASDIKVPATPSEIRVDGKDFSLHATYSSSTLQADDTYLLDSTASAFLPAEAENENGEVNVAPFTIFATSPAKVNEIVTNLPGTEFIPTGINEADMNVTELMVVKEGNAMVVYSPEARTENLYKADSSLVRVIRLNAGRNVIELPSTGIYIIADRKVIL